MAAVNDMFFGTIAKENSRRAGIGGRLQYLAAVISLAAVYCMTLWTIVPILLIMPGIALGIVLAIVLAAVMTFGGATLAAVVVAALVALFVAALAIPEWRVVLMGGVRAHLRSWVRYNTLYRDGGDAAVRPVDLGVNALALLLSLWLIDTIAINLEALNASLGSPVAPLVMPLFGRPTIIAITDFVGVGGAITFGWLSFTMVAAWVEPKGASVARQNKPQKPARAKGAKGGAQHKPNAIAALMADQNADETIRTAQIAAQVVETLRQQYGDALDVSYNVNGGGISFNVRGKRPPMPPQMPHKP